MKKTIPVPEKPVNIHSKPGSPPIRIDKVQRATLAVAMNLYGDHEVSVAIDRMAKDLTA